MVDIVAPATRSRMMAGIRGKNTKPELLLRSALHRHGFRFRLHGKDIVGRPDMVFPRYHAVIFVHGCFWHRHDCPLFKWPSTRPEFWREKLNKNAERDRRQISRLKENGWRVGIVWECAMRGRCKLSLETVTAICSAWLVSQDEELEIHGDWSG